MIQRFSLKQIFRAPLEFLRSSLVWQCQLGDPELITEKHRGAAVYRIIAVFTLVLLQSAASASAERIKRKPPTDIEAARLASDQAMSDGTLHVGDVIVTDRGFIQFRGFAPDGSSDFMSVPNPLSLAKKDGFGNPP